MKSFKTYVKEVALGTGSSGIARYNDGLHRIGYEDVKVRVNTWLQANSNMEFATVEAAGDSGALRIPLAQFGVKHDHAGEHTQPISIPEDLVMNIEYERMPTGGFRVSGQIQ